MNILFASDLDNTLIFSKRKIGNNAICVAKREGVPVSYMTLDSIELLARIYEMVEFIPITTRSVEQFRRINFTPLGIKHKYSLVSNGGILLVDGREDKYWSNETKSRISEYLPDILDALQAINSNYEVLSDARLIDSVFGFAALPDNEEVYLLFKDSYTNLDIVKFGKHKLYLLPKYLSKGNALDRLKLIINVDFTIGAGDSQLDMSMLERTDKAYLASNNLLTLVYNDLIYYMNKQC